VKVHVERRELFLHLFVLLVYQSHEYENKRLRKQFHAFFMQQYVEIDIGYMIRQELDRQERSIAWLAAKIGCHRTTLARMLQKKGINSEILFKISIEMKKDFHAQYSQKQVMMHLPKNAKNPDAI
jgi:DNA-binding NtrC family response regulator